MKEDVIYFTASLRHFKYLHQGDYVFFVFFKGLFLSRITENLVNRFTWNSVGGGGGGFPLFYDIFNDFQGHNSWILMKKKK